MVIVILSAAVMRLLRPYLESPPKVNIAVISEPPRAMVTLDNRHVGLTPLPSISVRPGAHSLKLDKYGWQRWSQRVKVKEEGTVLRIPLIPAVSAVVWVASEPPQGEVFLDGQRRGFSPVCLGPVRAGTHELRVTRLGFMPSVQQISVPPSQELKVSVKLESKTEEYLLSRIKRNPKDLMSHIELLHIYLINAKLDKARAMLVVALRLWTTEGADTDTAARLDQEIRKAYFAEYKVGGDEALEPLRATLEAAMEEVAFAPAGKPGQGGSIPVGLLLACLCEGAGKLDKARATYERLLSQHSGDVDVKRAYGLLLVRLQLMPEAAKVLGDVAAARPGDSVVLQSLGAAYTVLKKTDDALKTLMLVTEIQGLPTPERIGVETQIAGIYHSQGRFVQAAERWEKVWPLGENPDQQAELQLAAALEQNLAGNTNRAKELYNLVLAGPASQGLKDRARDGLSKQEQKKG